MKNGKKRGSIKRAALALLLWLLLWQLVSVAAARQFILPSPGAVVVALSRLMAEPLFWYSCLVSLLRVALGLALAAGAGFACAYGAWRSPSVKSVLAIPSGAIKSVPVVSVILFALLLLKSAWVPLFVCFFMCFPVMYTNILQGFEGVPPGYGELAQVYGFGKGKYFVKIMLPASAGYIKAGLDMCAGLAWKSTVAAEVLSSPKLSMGFHLMRAKMYLDGPSLFAWTAAIMLLSACFEKGLRKLLRRF